MSRKRRIFDIDLPEEPEVVAPEPVAKPGRKGPMASAISENAEALQARRSAVEQIRAENDALAHEYVALKEAGHVVQQVALDEVHTFLLVRDRLPGEDMELEELVASIRDLGLSNPIRVLPRPDGQGVELVQGYRRLTAYRRLLEETGDDRYRTIPALILPGAAGDVAGLYRQMVDENVIRKDLSFAEMAHAAVNYAADPATGAGDLATAIRELYSSAPASKRTYIKNFAYLIERLEGVLKYPAEVPRRLGVTLARAMMENGEIARRIRGELDGWDNRGVEDELEVLRRHAGGDALDDDGPMPKGGETGRPAKRGTARTRTTFNMDTAAGRAKCTAADGRLEIKIDRDFSTIDRARLEQAIAALVEGLR